MTRDHREIVGYHFGDFAVDIEERRLERAGTPVEIQDKPFELLLTLLEQPGRIVSREVIIRRLWPDGTFVDFERGLNTAVRKVRRALGDTARSPRYVETLPRRGYRLLVSATPIFAPSEIHMEVPAPASLVPLREDARVVSSRSRWRMPVRLAVTCAGALFFVAVGMLLARPGATRSESRCSAERPPVPAPAASENRDGSCAQGSAEERTASATPAFLFSGGCPEARREPTSH